MRTTVDIDDPILRELKQITKKERKSLGRVVSDLLAQALQKRKMSKHQRVNLKWISKDMKARINLEDKDAVYNVLDQRFTSDRKP